MLAAAPDTQTGTNQTTSRIEWLAGSNSLSAAIAAVSGEVTTAQLNNASNVVQIAGVNGTNSLAAKIAADINTISNVLADLVYNAKTPNLSQFYTNATGEFGLKSGAVSTNFSARGLTVPNATPGKVAVFNGLSGLTNSSLDSDLLGYLADVVSPIGAALNLKAALS